MGFRVRFDHLLSRVRQVLNELGYEPRGSDGGFSRYKDRLTWCTGEVSKRRYDSIGCDDTVVCYFRAVFDDCELALQNGEFRQTRQYVDTHNQAILPNLYAVSDNSGLDNRIRTKVDKVSYCHTIVVKVSLIRFIRRSESPQYY